jgi:hypothetical protein
MPGKALTYKFLNTFIDDLFAFTVKMKMTSSRRVARRWSQGILTVKAKRSSMKVFKNL